MGDFEKNLVLRKPNLQFAHLWTAWGGGLRETKSKLFKCFLKKTKKLNMQLYVYNDINVYKRIHECNKMKTYVQRT